MDKGAKMGDGMDNSVVSALVQNKLLRDQRVSVVRFHVKQSAGLFDLLLPGIVSTMFHVEHAEKMPY